MENFGLKEFLTEKFEENSKEHITIWEQVKFTNGRLRLVEKIVWVGIGGISFLSIGNAPEALKMVIGFIK